MTRTWLIIFLIVHSYQSFAQRYAISENGKVLACILEAGKDSETKQYYYEATVYSQPHKALLNRFPLKFGSKGDIETQKLSFNGKLLYVKMENDHRVYNTRIGELVHRNDKDVRIAMSNRDNFFVVSGPDFVKAFDAYTGEELIDYQTASNNKILRLEITENDEYVVALTDRNQVIFWQKDRAKTFKKFYGTDIAFNDAGTQFTISRETGTRLSIYQYELPTFKRKNRISVDKLLRDYAREKTVAIRARDPLQTRAIIPPAEMIPGEYKISTSGNYLAILARFEKDQKKMYVINNNTDEIKLEYTVGGMKQPVTLSWFNDSLLIPVQSMQPKVFNAQNGQFDEELKPSALLSFPEKRKNRVFMNQDFEFIAVNTDNGFTLQKTNNSLDKSFTGWKFLGFSQDARWMYLEGLESSRKGYVALNDPAFKIIPFSEKKVEFTEDEFAGEYDEPEGYDYNRITGFKHISEAKPKDSLKILMKSVVTGKKAGVQIQIIDKNGNHYHGAGSEFWKKIWCNLMVKGSNGKVRQIDDFTVTEHSASDSLPYAIAVIMDFSGSMGWAKADALQDGVEKFLLKKKEEDLVSLFKYDHRVQRETKLTDNPTKLLRKLYKTDYSAYGGSTALLDATQAGILSVAHAKNVARKIVLLFTDGMENSSVATKNEVLAQALENNVSIVTIAYGKLINKSYLKTLSYNTQGGFYEIFNSRDFTWIFDDIYQKAINYYAVQYETEDKGSQVYMLKICHESITQDSMVVEFENNPPDVDLLWESDEMEVNDPVAGKVKVETLGDFDFSNLTSFDNIQLEQPGLPEKIKIEEEDRMTAIEDEFMTIKLPRFNFYYDEVITVKEADERITELAEFLKKYPEVKIQIIGHTDNSGALEYNEKLAIDRATAVQKMIRKKGIPPNRLIVLGYGETSPKTSNATKEGRAKNRRVEFRIVE